jgi:hypothetical protein
MLSCTLKEYKEKCNSDLIVFLSEYEDNTLTFFLEKELSKYEEYLNSLLVLSKKLEGFTKKGLNVKPINSSAADKLKNINLKVYNDIVNVHKIKLDFEEVNGDFLLPFSVPSLINVDNVKLQNYVTSSRLILNFINEEHTISINNDSISFALYKYNRLPFFNLNSNFHKKEKSQTILNVFKKELFIDLEFWPEVKCELKDLIDNIRDTYNENFKKQCELEITRRLYLNGEPNKFFIRELDRNLNLTNASIFRIQENFKYYPEVMIEFYGRELPLQRYFDIAVMHFIEIYTFGKNRIEEINSLLQEKDKTSKVNLNDKIELDINNPSKFDYNNPSEKKVDNLNNISIEEKETNLVENSKNETTENKINIFDDVPYEDVIKHFKKLHENKYISLDDFELFINTVFVQNKTLTKKINIIKPNSANKVCNIFYIYFNTLIPQKYGNKGKYVKLLCDNFNGFKYNSINTNFSK